MKLKALLLSFVLFFNAYALANAPNEQETALKTSINQMITLIDQKNLAELINNYAYLKDEEKKEIINDLKEGASLSTTESLKEALIKASTLTPIFKNNEATIIFEDGTSNMIFMLNQGQWQLKN